LQAAWDSDKRDDRNIGDLRHVDWMEQGIISLRSCSAGEEEGGRYPYRKALTEGVVVPLGLDD